jgi:hypothetical protein
MSISRREFMRLVGLAGAAGMLPSSVFAQAKQPSDLYEVPKFGNVTLLHITDCHAQLNPIYFREPNVNIGIGGAFGKAPHLVGETLLKHFGIEARGHRGPRVQLSELSRGGGAVRSRRRLRAPEDPGRSHPRRTRRRQQPADGRRRHLAGLGNRLLDPGYGHGRRLQPARRRRHDRALGVHLPGRGGHQEHRRVQR